MKLYEKNFMIDENNVYRLEYSLLIQSAEQGKYYGVVIRKTDEAGNPEEEQVKGLCENREEAEQFLFRLAENLAMPVELTALCDDFISEGEFGKKSETEMTAC